MTKLGSFAQECALLEFSNEQCVNTLLKLTDHFTNENRLPCASRNLYFAVSDCLRQATPRYPSLVAIVRNTTETSAGRSGSSATR